MLRSLHIKNYILIDSLEVDFPEGLVIITGQTGAGKSILLGALALLAGSRADASMIGEGGETCVVEAEFGCEDDALRQFCEENDIEWDGGRVIVRRVIGKTGRSRAFVNDCPVQTASLASMSGYLFDIHSQHKSLLLSDRSFQLGLLDSFAGNADVSAQCRASWKRLGSLRAELSGLRESLQRMSADRDYNFAQWQQLDAAGLRDGELDELEAEQKQLANAELIKDNLHQAMALFEPEESLGVEAALKEAGRRLSHISRFIPSAGELADRMDAVRIEIADISAGICDLDSGISLSGERLQQVEDRMSELYSLMKKHGCSTVAELVEVRERYNGLLFDSSAVEERIAEVESAERREYEVYRELCGRLHTARVKAAPSLAAGICDSLHSLELDKAVFEVAVEDRGECADGTDAVSFLFSSTGQRLQDVSKCASGGEISRIMLCLKAMMARFAGMPTLIFDEIDTGVSGSVADSMGRMICAMGRDMQVFSITHLPQVAAKGDAHYVVRKAERDGRTVSSISEVRGIEREKEIARLLSGATITEAALANARELLESH